MLDLQKILSSRKEGNRESLLAFQGVLSALDLHEARGNRADTDSLVSCVVKEMKTYSEMLRDAKNETDSSSAEKRFLVLKHFLSENGIVIYPEEEYPKILQEFLTENNFKEKRQLGAALGACKKKFGNSLDFSKVKPILESLLV